MFPPFYTEAGTKRLGCLPRPIARKWQSQDANLSTLIPKSRLLTHSFCFSQPLGKISPLSFGSCCSPLLECFLPSPPGKTYPSVCTQELSLIWSLSPTRQNCTASSSGPPGCHFLLPWVKDIPHSTKKEHTNGQQVHEKVLNITNHQERANHNHYGISPHTFLNGYHQKAKGGTAEDEEKGPLPTVAGNVDWYNHYGNQY